MLLLFRKCSKCVLYYWNRNNRKDAKNRAELKKTILMKLNFCRNNVWGYARERSELANRSMRSPNQKEVQWKRRKKVTTIVMGATMSVFRRKCATCCYNRAPKVGRTTARAKARLAASTIARSITKANRKTIAILEFSMNDEIKEWRNVQEIHNRFLFPRSHFKISFIADSIPLTLFVCSAQSDFCKNKVEAILMNITLFCILR